MTEARGEDPLDDAVEARIAATVRCAAAIGALLGAAPFPTRVPLALLQAWLVGDIARRYGAETGAGSTLALVGPTLARTAGLSLWSEAAKLAGASAVVGMATGALLGGSLTWTLGELARAHFRPLAPKGTTPRPRAEQRAVTPQKAPSGRRGVRGAARGDSTRGAS